MQFSIVDVASVFFLFLSVNQYPREFDIQQKKKKTEKLGPAWQNVAGNHCISWQKKIAFSYSDPGDTLENKLNDLKPLYSRKKSFAFQKKLKKMLLHKRVNLADQHKQKPQEDACHVPYMTSQYETNLWSTHVNIVRLAEPIRFSFHFSRGQNRKSPFAPKPNGNACYAGYNL